MTNAWQESAREAKAEKLAKALVSDLRVAGHTDLESAGPDFRSLIAKVAGTRIPSDKTWQRACELARFDLARKAA